MFTGIVFLVGGLFLAVLFLLAYNPDDPTDGHL
jgi:hypothetical protein